MLSILSRRMVGLFVALVMVGAVTFALTEPARGAVIEHTCAKAGDLQTIIDAASPGDIIEVAAGVCTGKAFPAEDFSISEDIVLRGAGAGLTVLQGSGAPNSRVVGVHEGAVVTLGGLTITGGTIDEDNSGGGLINDGTTTLVGVAVSGNKAGGGGGIANNPGASLSLIDSTVSGNIVTNPNSAGGGGITNGLGSTLTLVNSTVSGNRAVAPSASASGFAGGIQADALSKVSLVNSTVTANVAERGPGGGIYSFPSADVVLTNSIVAGNAGLSASDCFGAITSQGNNLIGTTGGCTYTPGPGDLTGVNPNLGPLADNGSFTRTHALLAGSPAIDHSVAPCPSALDQRGVFRPQGDGCDIGATEKENPLSASVGLVDPATGQWHLRDAVGPAADFYYGNPGDYPIMGDWDCNQTDTPGLYRQSDGYVYLRNSNTQGIADIKFYFGNPGDIPIVGDFNADGCDTVSIYRQTEGRVYIINKLGENDGGLGAADYDYYFGNPGDKPFTGDFNGNGTTTVGLHRESTGFVYFRNTNTQGNADTQFYFGDPGDRLVAGDWNNSGVDSPALFRPSATMFFFRFTNTQGNADAQFVWGEPGWLPVAGTFGLG